nr:preprotein translocase subunit SecY [Cryptomonas borealis]
MKNFKNKNGLKKRIHLTGWLLVFSRFGTFIPLPGIDHEAFYQNIPKDSIVNLLNMFSSSGVACIGVFALGIVPYINASILMQLGTTSIPSLERLQKEEGEFGRQTIAQITKYITLGWAIIESFVVSLWLRPYVFDWNTQFVIGMTLALTAGAMIIMWISEQITEKGIGNGPSLLIFINILAGLSKWIQQGGIQIHNLNNLLELLVLITVSLGMIIGIIFIQEGARQIPIVSARQLGKKQIETKTSYLPLRLNQGGVMPIIFASTFLMLPNYISPLITNTTISKILNELSPTGQNKIIYVLCYFFLILIFSHLYNSLILNTEEIANNLKKMECSIPGIKPGKATAYYLQKTISRLTFLGALFLASITVIPTIIESTLGLATFKGFGSTSLIILVGVSIDTYRQIQTYMISEKYEDMID